MDSYFGNFQLIRLIFQRSLAAVYLIAFISALNQFPALLGQNGLLPVPLYIKSVPFGQSPSIFYLAYSDGLFAVVAWIGIAFSLTIILGIFEKFPWWVSMAAWLIMWFLYLSIVNVGQAFYSFGWETMLCEAGFFAAFLGPSKIQASIIPILILRWMLFRTELGAGLIKIRGDQCWRDLTCLYYHFQTQPMPNPLSWFFYYTPKFLLRIGVVFSHFIQIIAPFGLFAPWRIAAAAGGLIIFHQLILIVSGNYSWLNWLTVVLGFTVFCDAVLKPFSPLNISIGMARSVFNNWLLQALFIAVLFLSIQPAMNFFSKNQLMNYSYNSLHLVDSYGAFGAISKDRYEVVIEGTSDALITPATKWQEYEFKGKPGNVYRMPSQIAPYHLRLDWLMWFLPFSVDVAEKKVLVRGYEFWYIRFIEKLLQGDKKTIGLLRYSPFTDKPPRFIRARYYLYRFTDPRERKETGAWWKRTLLGDYMPPVSLADMKNI